MHAQCRWLTLFNDGPIYYDDKERQLTSTRLNSNRVGEGRGSVEVWQHR